MSVDRLQELRKKKRPQQDIIEALDSGSAPPPAVEMGQVQIQREDGGEDVDQQVALYRPINALIEEIRKSTENLDALRGKDAKAADDKTRKKIMSEMNETVSKVMSLSGSVKDALMQIKDMNDKFDQEQGNQQSARSQVRHNLYQATVRRFQEHAAEFADSREAFRVSVQERMARQIKIVDPTKSDADAIKLIEAGQAEAIITKALASDNLKEVVQELRARNQELLMLQRSVEALYEMFKDLYSLIEMQAESINVIEQRVARSLDYVQKGEQELIKAKEHQKKAGKLKCILLLIFLVIAIIIITPILITATSKGEGESHGGEGE